MLLLTLNEGFDRKGINILLTLEKVKNLDVLGDAVIECAGLIASGLVSVDKRGSTEYTLNLSDKGRLFLDGWKKGDQQTAVNAGSTPTETEGERNMTE